MKSFAGTGSMEGWLTRIATNTCLNILRAARRRPELVTSDLGENETEWLERVSDSSRAQPLDAEQKVIAADLAQRLLEALPAHGEWRMLVSPDHRTPLRTRAHAHGEVPFVVAGTGIESLGQASYDEVVAAASDLAFAKGHQLMPWFLGT